ncbi:MAG: DUF4231 domain-containing protein [Anaerolineae bacterium]|nr:DUF4231 domain-containing protein [Anaerolineae bacterium]
MAQSTTTKTQEEPRSQQKKGFRDGWPAWMKQLPVWNFPPPAEEFELIPSAEIEKLLSTSEPEVRQRILEDLNYLDHELLRLFKERDHNASLQQNRYRMLQLGYMVLAALAALVGSFQALTLIDNPNWTAVFAFIETVVAAFVTFLATISGREPPMNLWLTNRRRAEYLRREYFRYLVNLPPYNEVTGYERRMLLSERAANINRGFFPDKTGEGDSTPNRKPAQAATADANP